MGKVSLLKAALANRPCGLSYRDLHNSKSSCLPNETISCSNADAHGCEVISNCFKHPSPYCKWCISLSITDCDDTNGDSEVEVPRTERFSIAASSSPSRGTLPTSGKSSGACPPCHSRTSAAANMAHPHPLPEVCNRRPHADSAVADAHARTGRLSDRTSSHNRSREMRQPGSLGGSHPDSHRPGWLACAAPPRRGPPTTTPAGVTGGYAEEYVAAGGVGPTPAARSLW